MKYLDVSKPKYPNREPGIYDDTYAPLNASWTKERLVRISVISDGNCFIHALLKALYKPYQESESYEEREQQSRTLRAQIAEAMFTLSAISRDKLSYWAAADNGSLTINYARTLQKKDYERTNPKAYADIISDPNKMYTLLSDPKKWIHAEFVNMIADMLNINIYLLGAKQVVRNNTEEDTFLAGYNVYANVKKKISCLIIGNGLHFEVVAKQTSRGFQTCFEPDDKLVQDLLDMVILESYGPSDEIRSNIQITNELRDLPSDDPLFVALKQLKMI